MAQQRISSEDISRVVSRTLDAATTMADEAVVATRSFLASEQGRKLRRNMAGILIVGAPIVSELPLVRRTPMARLLRTAAVTTLLVKGAEWIRDWEPRQAEAQG